jgi:3-keto-5-aminohexanoate cleavage enzyme
MGKKIIISLAPTGGWGPGRNNPIDPSEIVDTVLASAEAGASVVHMHARDLEGNLTSDLQYLTRTIEAIRSESDIIIEASTGGISELTAQERVMPVSIPGVSLGSLNVGSLNFGDDVYQNSLPHIRLWIEHMNTAGVKPSLEIFDTGNILTARHCIDEGMIEPQYNFTFIFNCLWGMGFTDEVLAACTSLLPPRSIWGALFVGSESFTPHLSAAIAGASAIRVGFEDSPVLDGSEAGSNIELVRALRRQLEARDFEIADTSEARRMLGLSS